MLAAAGACLVLAAAVAGPCLPANSAVARLFAVRTTVQSAITQAALRVAAIVVFAVLALYFIGKARLESALAYRSYLGEPAAPLTTRTAVETAARRYVDHCDGRLDDHDRAPL
ncbi:MAG TPA: hypothetical protein VJX10_11975 [Pseudonocardiaceae bacterium]|nr:hypothetical protein [Pseudonocardiaceae bacterium]